MRFTLVVQLKFRITFKPSKAVFLILEIRDYICIFA